MLLRTETIDYKNYAKAFFAYLTTVSAVFATKTSGFWWGASNTEDSDKAIPLLKRTALQLEETQPLILASLSGRYNISRNIQDIVVQNTTVYMAAGALGLQIFDVSNESNLVLISQYDTPGFAHQVVIDNGYAYIADDEPGLVIVDINNIYSPAYVGGYCLGSNPGRLPVTHVAVAAKRAFIFDADTGEFDVVNVSIPDTVFRGYLDMQPSVGTGIALSGNIAYLSIASFEIVDISSPSNPQLLSYLSDFQFSDAIDVSGSIVYLATNNFTGFYGVFMIDVADPYSPNLLGSFSTNYFIKAIDVINNMAYLVGNVGNSSVQYGLMIVNVTTLSNPQILARYKTPGTAEDVKVQGNIAYIADGLKGIQVIDVTKPTSPILLNNLITPIAAGCVDMIGNILYVADYGSLRIFNATNPKNLSLLGVFNSSGITGLSVSGDIACILRSPLNQFVNLSKINNPVLIGTFDLPSGIATSSVKLIGDVAYIASNGLQNIPVRSGFQSVLNINDRICENQLITDLFAEGNNVFYTAQNKGLTFLNGLTFEVSSWHLGFNDFFTDISVINHIAYATDEYGLLIFNTTIPQTPQILSQFNLSSGGQGITNAGNLAYLWGGDNNFQIINNSNVISPKYITAFNTTGTVQNIVVANNVVYAAEDAFGLEIIAVSSSESLSLLSRIPISAGADDVKIDGAIAIILDGDQKLLIYDVGNLSNPYLITIITSTGYLVGEGNPGFRFAAAGDIVYVPSRGQLQIYLLSDPFNPQLLSATGNLVYYRGFVNLVPNALYLNLEIVDMTDLPCPVFSRKYVTPDDVPNGIVVSGNFIYVAASYSGMRIIDLTAAQNIFYPISTASQITAFNSRAYLADSTGNLYIFNITDINNPIEITRISLLYNALDMVADSRYLYIAEGLFGVEILDISDVNQTVFSGRITSGLTNAKSVKIDGNKLYVIDNYQEIVTYDISPLFYLRGQMVLQEGQRLIVTPSDVAVTGFSGVSASQLIMTAENVTHAQFELNTQPGIAIVNFTLAQVQAGQIIFAQDGGKIAPSFNLRVSDGTTTKGPFTANIVFQPINYPPVLGSHFIQINEGQSIILTSANFNASDDLTPAKELLFVTTQQANSQFEQISQPGVIITHFTQQDIVNGYILFRHLDQNINADLTPYCLVAAFDGQLYSTPTQVQFVYHPAPKFINNQLNIFIGETVTLSANDLQASVPADPGGNITFIISNVTHGSFTKMMFTQEEITQGLIQFQQDGSDSAPSYSVSIENAYMITPSQPAVVTFTDKNTNLALDAGGIGGTVAGSAAGLALLLGGIFAYRNYARNEQSRKNNPFAAAVYQALKPIDAANFNSPKGKQFIQAVQSLKQELSQQGIDVDRMGNWELNQLAEQVTLAIHSEISNKTNWRKESEIDADEISAAASQLALAIQKIRAGVYEISINSI